MVVPTLPHDLNTQYLQVNKHEGSETQHKITTSHVHPAFATDMNNKSAKVVK